MLVSLIKALHTNLILKPKNKSSPNTLKTFLDGVSTNYLLPAETKINKTYFKGVS
jgi:hypothetical protein